MPNFHGDTSGGFEEGLVGNGEVSEGLPLLPALFPGHRHSRGFLYRLRPILPTELEGPQNPKKSWRLPECIQASPPPPPATNRLPVLHPGTPAGLSHLITPSPLAHVSPAIPALCSLKPSSLSCFRPWLSLSPPRSCTGTLPPSCPKRDRGFLSDSRQARVHLRCR